MTHTQFLKWLGAPLANTRWSWGSVRKSDGAVFLLVWQDRKERIDDSLFFQVSFRLEDDDPENVGLRERLDHVELVRQGARCFLVICIAKDVDSRPRDVKEFIRERVFLGGEVIEHKNASWIKFGKAIPANEARQSG